MAVSLDGQATFSYMAGWMKKVYSVLQTYLVGYCVKKEQ